MEMVNNRAKILYIFFLWKPLLKFFLKGEETVEGLISFWIPFLKLLNSPEVDKIVALIFVNKKLCPTKRFVIPTKYSNKLLIYPIYFNGNFKSISFVLLKLPYAIYKGIYLILKYKINKIYGHGTIGALAGVLSLFTGVPNIRRLYGMSRAKSDFHLPKWQFFLKHPTTYLSLSLKAEAIIMTNDGSWGDKFFSKFGNRKSKFLFLFDGVEKNLESHIKKPKNIELPQQYISYIARIDRFKRQHLAIKAFSFLKSSQQNDFPHLVILGPISDEGYYRELITLCKTLDLENKVHFISALPWEEALFVLKKSKITLILYELSTLSNVFLESLVLQVPIIAINANNSFSSIPKDIYFEVKETPQLIADRIMKLLNDESLAKEMTEKGKKFVDQYFLSWEERARIELEILLN